MCIYTCICVYMYVYTHICICMYICICIYAHICRYTYMYMYIHIYMYYIERIYLHYTIYMKIYIFFSAWNRQLISQTITTGPAQEETCAYFVQTNNNKGTPTRLVPCTMAEKDGESFLGILFFLAIRSLIGTRNIDVICSQNIEVFFYVCFIFIYQ